MFETVKSFFTKDLAIDLGTANTLIYKKGHGIVLNEPSVVAIERHTGKVIAVGHDAKKYLGKTPEKIAAIRPMKDGVIADFEVTAVMIKYFLKKVSRRFNLIKPLMVVAVPTGVTQVEKRAVIDEAMDAGARGVFLIEEPMAAAIGTDLPVDQPIGSMVVDIGGGTTEVAIISLSSTGYSESVRVAGDEANEAIIRYIYKKFQVSIGENTAENIKIRIGSAKPFSTPVEITFSGKSMINGIPENITITDEDIRTALKDPISIIVESVIKAFEKSPPDLSADIYQNGIYLAGGGALIKGLDSLIHDVTKLPVYISEDPLTSVVRGAGKVVENIQKYSKVFIN